MTLTNVVSERHCIANNCMTNKREMFLECQHRFQQQVFRNVMQLVCTTLGYIGLVHVYLRATVCEDG